MANTFKNAWIEHVSNSPGSPTTILTCPSGDSSKCVLIGMHVTNTHASGDVAVTINVFDNSATNTLTFMREIAVSVNTTLDVLDSSKLILEESDAVNVFCDTAYSVNVLLSYLLVDST